MHDGLIMKKPVRIVRKVSMGLLLLSVGVTAVSGDDTNRKESATSAVAPTSSNADRAQKSESGSLFGVITSIFMGNSDKSTQKNTAISGTDTFQSGSSTDPSVKSPSRSKFSSVVLDPSCKQPVLPYGITENVGKLIWETLKQFPSGTNLPEAGRAAAKELNWIPMDVERQIGLNMLNESQVLDEDKNKESKELYKRARDVLSDVLKQLPVDQPFDFRIYVMKTNFGNATALPGGIIQVDRDLFGKKADPDFAYFVIAHEVAHVLQRHQTKSYQATLIDSVSTLIDLRDLIKQASAANADNALSYATTLKKLVVSFSEQQELQSDSCALRFMSARYKHQSDFEKSLRKIEKKLGPFIAPTTDDSKDPEIIQKFKYLGDGILERHPNTSERIANFQMTSKEIYKAN